MKGYDGCKICKDLGTIQELIKEYIKGKHFNILGNCFICLITNLEKQIKRKYKKPKGGTGWQ